MLNQAAVERLELDGPIGTEPEWEGEGRVLVVGVVENFNLQNAWAGLGPVVLLAVQPGKCFRSLSVRLAAGTKGGMDTVQSAWIEVLSDAPFEYNFLDEKIAGAYEMEQETRRLVGAGTGLALFVAFLGLVGLTSFTVPRRTKEIGIRKALGASNSLRGRFSWGDL